MFFFLLLFLISATLRENFPREKVPKRSLPNFLLYFLSFFIPNVPSWEMLTQVTEKREYDNSKSKTGLGIKNLPEEKSITDTANSILELGLLQEKIGENSIFG